VEARLRGIDLRALLRIGFRNITRNRRRTALTVGGIAFAVLLVGLSAALQDGGYAMQRQISTDLLTGHLQVSHPEWPVDADVSQLITDVTATTQRLESLPGITMVAPRLQMSALVSHGERSAASLVIGFDLEREAGVTLLLKRLETGRLPENDGEIALGVGLVRHLGVEPGDEVVVLGSDPEGGMAAMALTLSGVLDSGLPELDRALAVVRYEALAQALSVNDAAHLLVLRAGDPLLAVHLSATVAGALTPDQTLRSWQEIQPEIESAIELDRLGGYIFFAVVLFLVCFSVANTFVMVIFERTREIGMLRSLGMHPWSIIGLLQIEAAGLWFVGVMTGLLLAIPLLFWLKLEGLYLGESLEATMTQMYMPTRMYAELSPRSLFATPIVLLVTTQLAALVPGLRVRRIQPADAMRHMA
jgi:putative ABC transport system permease protein